MIQIQESESGRFIIQLDQAFDFESHKDFRECIKEAVTKKAQELSIDFNNVEYIDSSALGMLMLAKHETTQNSCALNIINLNDGHAKNVLSLVKFDQLFTIK